MRTWRTFRLGIMAALCASVLVGAGLFLAALNTGGAAGPVRVAAGFDRAGQRLLAQPGFGPEQALQVARLSQQALAEYPYDMRGWMGLLEAQAAGQPSLRPETIAALRRTYVLIPVDRDYGAWRLHFALEHINQLPPDLKAAARNELVTLWSIRRRRDLRVMIRGLHNPAGRLAVALWL